MDPDKSMWGDPEPDDWYWETYDRRDSVNRYRDGDSTSYAEVFDSDETAWVPVEGVNAWLKLSTSAKRIHHHCSVEAATGRCTTKSPISVKYRVKNDLKTIHRNPWFGYVPGADLAGIELRVLAHYLARYDGGKYAEVLLHGDIHQQNADAMEYHGNRSRLLLTR